MQTWIIITFAAAFLQNMRSTLQKHLKGKMSTSAATFVRFGFGAPFALLYAFTYIKLSGNPLPSPNADFIFWAVLVALTQIGATFLLVQAFSYRNFAVATAYSRTEPAQAALFALIFLGERLSAPAFVAIMISVVGVMLISVARTEFSVQSLVSSTFSPVALLGLASGTLFGIAAISVRSASLALDATLAKPDFVMSAGVTLSSVILFQTVIFGLWILWKEPQEFSRIRAAWTPSLATGFMGATASFGWFMAMTLQQAAVVKALAQVELLFTFASTVFIFKETINRLELAGCAAIVLGILVLLLA
jgi:drug/metabolite transporter (DMT)-like permease